ncbi:UvrD-helicase domain-containing protein [Lutibacter holmesii]|uniref:DNA 3'-5' helicase n=1 Tax=Lutibacter holmesii TaxID=1137985 RepID=A0ABW3WNX3_9FLAO
MQDTAPFQIYNASAGSGKTFTLVKEYLKILLASNNQYKFQQILAVTFTNKAAGEMKTRVIENLQDFSNEEESNSMLPIICKETSLPKQTIFNRSKTVLSAILQNYSAFNITTIDSFTHKLIRTFAYDLDLPLNSEVEMDTESLLNEAVDIVISKIGENKELTGVLVNYAIQKLDDDKSWDISLDLKNFAKLILNESDAVHLKSLHEISMDEFKSLKEELQKENKKIAETFKSIGEQGLEIINNTGVTHKDFYYSLIPKHFEQLVADAKKAKFFDQGKLKVRIEEEMFYSKSKSDAVKSAIDAVIPTLVNLYNQSEVLFQQKTLNDLFLNSLIPLAVLSHINKALQDLKQENNILLNAEFNQLISDTIKDEPAPFIYERIGEKFRYYFIDEMQDTSILQWQNLIPLVENAISSADEFGEKGKLLLVGDAKQSIYRWRGGKAEQFIGLSAKNENTNPFYVEEEIKNLATNYRSFSEVITFNNQFFTHISQFLGNEKFRNLYAEGNSQLLNSNEGGYVELSFLEDEKEADERALMFPRKVFEIIDNLDPKFQKNEVCVLVRTKKQGVEVANYLTEKGIEIISSETLLLKNSPKVTFIINLLNVIQNPTNKEFKVQLLYYLYDYLEIQIDKHQFLNEFVHLENQLFFEGLKQFQTFFNYNEFVKSPFYESIEYCIRSFQLVKTSDANIQFFLDVVFEYQQKKQVSIGGFLEYWDLKKDKLSIVASEAKNAVRIMTIHKAKGLEFPVVIYPYDIDIYNQINPKVWYTFNNQTSNLKSLLVSYGKKLNYIGEQGVALFDERKEELELDNYNILYVALTRAVEQLYVVTKLKISKKTNEEDLKFTSGLFINYLKGLNLWSNEKLTYSFGNPMRGDFEETKESQTTTQEHFISNSWKNHNISIVANSSLLWDTDQGKAIVYGNLIHEILSKINTKSDIKEVVNQYLYKGIITSSAFDQIISIVSNVVEHEKLAQYFEQNNTVFTEREILTADKRIVIPDRLVLNNEEVTIIDYKTGKPEKKHVHQVNEYASVLESLDYKIANKLLVYINNEITIKEV